MPIPIKKIFKIPVKKSFLSKRLWKDGTMICEMENRPAYKSEQELKQTYDKKFPRFSLSKIWLCQFCAHWHAVASPPPPSGETSGNKKRKLEIGHIE